MGEKIQRPGGMGVSGKLIEPPLELGAGAAELGLRRVLGDEELLGNFVVAQAFQNEEFKHGPITLRKKVKHFSQILPVQEVARTRLIGSWVHFVKADFLVEVSVLRQIHEALVYDDFTDPAFKTPLQLELADSIEDLPERYDQHIFRCGRLLDVFIAKREHLRREAIKQFALGLWAMLQATKKQLVDTVDVRERGRSLSQREGFHEI